LAARRRRRHHHAAQLEAVVRRMPSLSPPLLPLFRHDAANIRPLAADTRLFSLTNTRHAIHAGWLQRCRQRARLASWPPWPCWLPPVSQLGGLP